MVIGQASVDLVVGVLGVLRAGAAFVPTPSSYPADRIERMARAAGIAAVLYSRSADVPSGLRADAFDIAVLSTSDPSGRLDFAAPRLVPSSLAYIVFTSGSTGEPKGVRIEHGALGNGAIFVEDDERDAIDVRGHETSVRRRSVTTGRAAACPPDPEAEA